MIGKILWHVLVRMQQPDPPHVARAKRVARDVTAAAQLSNELLPLVLDRDPVSPTPKE